ncbi:MAG: hypothetical protein OXC46_10935 [Thaumarchaeota archaeon]|nr:hypothetical protein [Nitrososphaerota archaeon]
MEEQLLRVAVLGIILAPMALSDLRTRGVMTDILAMGLGISVCFAVYDFATNSVAEFCMPLLVSYLFSIVTGVMAVLLAKRMSIGTSDGYVMLIIAFMLPHIGGLPASMAILFTGLALCAIFRVIIPLFRNISNAISGKKYCKDIIFHYMKRKGEKFCIQNMIIHDSGRFVDIDGKPVIVKKDGSNYFLGENDENIPVILAMPLVFFLAIGYGIVSLLLLYSAGYIAELYPVLSCHDLA